MKTFCVVGHDARQRAAAQTLQAAGFRIIGPEAACQADFVLLPMSQERVSDAVARTLQGVRPGTLLLAGRPGSPIQAAARQASLPLLDYFQRPELECLNAVPTAEGCLALLLQLRRRTIWESDFLVLGYGRIGRAVARRLDLLGGHTTVAARNAVQRANARCAGHRAAPLDRLAVLLAKHDTVINTIPAPVLPRKMLEKLEGEGRLVGLDIDPIESEKTVKRLRAAGFSEDTFQFRLMNFANIDKVAEEFGQFDFVLADLGVSSMQIDDPKRGFSYKTEGPLDLRLDPMHGDSAADRLLQVTQKEFEGMLIENSDEPYAAEIAASVFGRLKNGKKIETTTDLRNAVEAALVRLPKAEREEAVKKSCARTFQALRIDVNSEFEVLYSFLEKLDGILKPGGRVAILTFHSGEDRLVKKAFKELKKAGVYAEISADVIRPSAEECRLNPRARSTKMRWAVKAE